MSFFFFLQFLPVTFKILRIVAFSFTGHSVNWQSHFSTQKIMASGVEKKITKHLECAICMETFKEPKMLTCQHSYCKKCLGRLVIADGRGNYKIICPECRQKTQVMNVDITYCLCVVKTLSYVRHTALYIHSDTP